MSTEFAVAGHYARPRIADTILSAVSRAGKDPARLTARDLTPVDQFHVGGVRATEELAAQMDVAPGMHLLDIGCGIGGAARYFATERGCRVHGIDLTHEFVEAAADLSRLVNMDGAVRFRQASATCLPFDDASFDGAYLIHVGMNLSDKPAVFREVRRVLKPGAVFGIFDVMRTADTPIRFPVPWAATEETSFVDDSAAYRAALEAAGFRVTKERSRRAFAIEEAERAMARVRESGPPALGLHLLMGERTQALLGNITAMMKEGLLDPVELIARAQHG